MDWKYKEGRIYSTDEKGELLAEATFVRREHGEIEIDHTYVNPSLRGQGVAGKMMKVVADYIREKGLKATATCSYASDWFRKNAESYADILLKDHGDQAPACKINGKH
jgi:predicted GNAT family acetyltransferase